MSPTWEIEAISGLIPIHLYLDKISSHQQIRTAFLSSNHVIKLLLEHYHSTDSTPHHLSLRKLTSKQRLKVKSFIVNTNNYLNGIHYSFNSLHKECSPDFWLVDIFSNYFLFNTINCNSNNAKSAHFYKLNKIFEDSLWDTKTIVIISDASIKNNAAISIAHVCSEPNIITKTIQHIVNVISTEAELFARINQVIQFIGALYIIVITNHLARCTFDSLSHFYQL